MLCRKEVVPNNLLRFGCTVLNSLVDTSTLRGRPTIMQIQVLFNLKFATRYDERASVHVGYCPALGIYSQGQTEPQAENAIVNAAKLFIITCYGRDILHRVLRERGMTRAVIANASDIAKHEQELMTKAEQEFISVRPRFEKEFDREVAINLIPETEGLKACVN